jgi:hypothetical protein
MNAETIEGTGLAPAGYGIAELLYLLGCYDTPSTKTSADALMLQWPSSSDDLRVAGTSSLLARQQLKLEGDELVPTGLALAVAYALGNATRWTSASFLSDDAPQAAVFIHAPDLAAFLQPRGLGGWFAQVQMPSHSIAETLATLAAEHCSQALNAKVVLSSTTDGSLSRNVILRASGDRWEAALSRGDERAVPLDRTLNIAEVESLLNEQLLG